MCGGVGIIKAGSATPSGLTVPGASAPRRGHTAEPLAGARRRGADRPQRPGWTRADPRGRQACRVHCGAARRSSDRSPPPGRRDDAPPESRATGLRRGEVGGRVPPAGPPRRGAASDPEELGNVLLWWRLSRTRARLERFQCARASTLSSAFCPWIKAEKEPECLELRNTITRCLNINKQVRTQPKDSPPKQNIQKPKKNGKQEKNQGCA